MEGVFTPEIWKNVALRTGISELQITTRDEPDYDKLMRYRLEILEKNGIELSFIQSVISSMDLLPGAGEFFSSIQERAQAVVVTDSFIEFAEPFIVKLGRPLVFCHSLKCDERGIITDYIIRQPDPKRKVVEALHSLRYSVIAVGDSYNDMGMIEEADRGILFSPPDNVISDYPDYPVARDYKELTAEIERALAREK